MDALSPVPELARKSHDYPGKLIIVEGIDGSGKSTQLKLLHKWLLSEGYSAYLSEWNSSVLVKSTTSLGKRKKLLTPTTFSLIHATDFADRLEHQFIPLLKAGMIVLADRYMFTALARDVARGVSSKWVRNLYDFSIVPDISFYFRVDLETSVQRILSGRARLKYYEAGMDLGLTPDINESFKLFQKRILDEYERMIEEFGFQVVDGSQTIEQQQRLVRKTVADQLGASYSSGKAGAGRRRPRGVTEGSLAQAARQAHEAAKMREAEHEAHGPVLETKPNGVPLSTFENGVTHPQLQRAAGKLIVIEGPDRVGRSTQIALLRDWLETGGHAVSDTGFRRSDLTRQGLEEAKEGHTLGRLTMSLFYATDFADRLQNQIIPALKAGFYVLSDRYIYSIFARDLARGADFHWLEGVHSFALIPHITIYLRVDVEELIPRVIAGGGFNYWESGMDLGMADNMFDSFLIYQKKIISELDAMAERYDFVTVDASRNPGAVFQDVKMILQERLAP